MLKKPASVVFAPLRGSPYGTEYDFAPSLAAALLATFLNILRLNILQSDRVSAEMLVSFPRPYKKVISPIAEPVLDAHYAKRSKGNAIAFPSLLAGFCAEP